MSDTELAAVAREYDAPEWETPVPLDAGTVPPFPVDVLPPVLADYVRAVVDFAEVPADLPGVLTLAVAAAAVARKAQVEAPPGYCEPLNLFAVAALEPGERKSSVFREVTAPLVAYERELLDRMGREIAEAQSRAHVREKELAHAEASAAKATGADRMKWDNAVRTLAHAVRDTEIPAEPRVLMSDATPEAVAHGLAEQGGRLAVFSPEGEPFALLRRYSKDGNANFEVYNKAHAGDEIRVDRRHAKPVTVERPALTVGLAVQPHVLRGLTTDRAYRECGLLARFLYAVPASLVGTRTLNGPAVPAHVAARYRNAVLWLCRWPAQADPLTLTPEAFAVWHAYGLVVEPELAAGGRYFTIRDWAKKLPGLVARLGGVLHAVQGAAVQRIGTRIEAGTMADAVRLGEYAAAHALAAFGMMGADPVLTDARTILDWLTRTRLATFTTRDTYREHRALTRATARAALDALAERWAWIRPIADGKRNGRPSELWAVHPGLLGDARE